MRPDQFTQRLAHVTEQFPEQTVETMADKARLIDLLLPVGCVACGVLFLPTEMKAVGALAGGLLGTGLCWLIRSNDAADRAPDKAPSALSAKDKASVLAAVPIPLLVLDANGVVKTATSEAAQLLGREVERQHISTVFRAPPILAAVERALKHGTEGSVEFRINRPRQMALTATIRALRKDAAGCVVLMLQDNTNRVRIEDARSDFVANASHELRTPLAAISGLVETMQGPAKNDPAAQERFLGLIAKQTHRMTRLANDLLSLSRVEADENILPTTEQDIAEILWEALAAIAPVAEAANAQIETDIAAALPKVRGSREELTQVFVNLLENAIKYAGDDGPMRVSAHSDGSVLKVKVSDCGPGINPESIPRLTERFYRVDPTDSRTRGGTGLGLAIVKHIVSRHRGSLDITSKLGNGSEFTVTLPILQSVDTAGA